MTTMTRGQRAAATRKKNAAQKKREETAARTKTASTLLSQCGGCLKEAIGTLIDASAPAKRSTRKPR